VLAGEGWHRGVIGIVAQRVAERYHRPALVIGIEDGVGVGSGRSIKRFHLLDALTSVGDLFHVLADMRRRRIRDCEGTHSGIDPAL